MAKKAVRGARPAKSPKGDRWTVRGVPSGLQKAAGDAARAKGLTLGQWLCEVLSEALPRRAQVPAEAAQAWEAAIERRLSRLETAVLGESAGASGTATAAAAAEPPSGHAAA